MRHLFASLLIGLGTLAAADATGAASLMHEMGDVGALGFAGDLVCSATVVGEIPSFARFDPALGSLDRVSIRLLGTASARKLLAGPAVVSVFAYHRSALFDNDDNLLASFEGPLGESGATLADGESRLVGDGNSFAGHFEISDVARFLGSGSLAITVATFLRFNGLEVTPESGAMAFRIVTVDYRYTPIPEPGTASLLLAAIAGLAAERRFARQPRSATAPRRA